MRVSASRHRLVVAQRGPKEGGRGKGAAYRWPRLSCIQYAEDACHPLSKWTAHEDADHWRCKPSSGMHYIVLDETATIKKRKLVDNDNSTGHLCDRGRLLSRFYITNTSGSSYMRCQRQRDCGFGPKRLNHRLAARLRKLDAGCDTPSIYL